MTDVSTLLDDARAGLSPTAEDTSRVRQKLLAVVAAPALIAAAPAPAVPLVKLGVLGAGLLAAVFATVIALRPSSPVAPAPVSLPAPPPAPAPVITPLPEPEPEPEPEPVKIEPQRGTAAKKPPVAPPPPDDSLARELRHLSAARAALRGGDKAAARAALEEYDLEFDDNGQLAAEAAKLAKEASDAP